MQTRIHSNTAQADCLLDTSYHKNTVSTYSRATNVLHNFHTKCKILPPLHFFQVHGQWLALFRMTHWLKIHWSFVIYPMTATFIEDWLNILTNCSKHWYTGCLPDLTIATSFDFWLTHWLNILIEILIHWSFDISNDHNIHWCICWLLSDWLIDTLIDWNIDWLIIFCALILRHNYQSRCRSCIVWLKCCLFWFVWLKYWLMILLSIDLTS